MSSLTAAPATINPPPSRSPLRKPVPSSQHPPQQPSARLAPLTKVNHESGVNSRFSLSSSSQPSHPQAPRSQPPPQQSTHSRSASSGTFSSSVNSADPNHRYTLDSAPYTAPSNGLASPNNANMAYQQQYSNPQYSPMARRTLSNATTSTTSTGGRKTSFNGTTLSRTTSSRSGNSPNSYVALMRRQKATVWSDRAQHEDPRLVAQQRAAKMRAAMEVSGAHAHAGSYSMTSGGVRAKIRQHGVQKAQQYTPIAHPASGVPLRLSAREVEDDADDDDHLAVRGGTHQRNGSSRSSMGSTGRVSSTYGPGVGTTTGRSSEGSTPPQTRGSAAANTMDGRPRADTQSTIRSEDVADPTPVPDDFRGNDYFSGTNSNTMTTASTAAEESEADFGHAAGLPKRVKNLALDEKSAEDLQRRGSVDERTSTMRGYGRLFVANPDLSD